MMYQEPLEYSVPQNQTYNLPQNQVYNVPQNQGYNLPQNQVYNLPRCYDPRVDMLISDIAQMGWYMAQQHAYLEYLKDEREYKNAEAYSQITSDGQVYAVKDKRGNRHAIISAIFEKVFYITFKAPHTLEPHYVIVLKNNPKPFVISESNFYRPSVLLNTIALASGQSPAHFKTANITAALLRTFISANAQKEEMPFYKGWDENNTFAIFSHRTTHSTRACDPKNTPVEKPALPTPSSSLHAAEQFIQLMDTIANRGIQAIICLWFHTCAMSSLLDSLNYSVPMGLCFYSIDSGVSRYLDSFFSWYGDAIIPMALEKEQFLVELVERKDQPCWIRDNGDYSETAEIIESALRTRRITVGKDTVKLVSLPTVFSNSVSTLSVSSLFATIEIDCADFVCCTGEHLAALRQYVFDYIVSFNRWVEEHVDILRTYISRGIDTVLMDNSGLYLDLSEEGINTLGILFGVRQIVAEFYRALGLNETAYQHVIEMIRPSDSNVFVTALSNASNCSSCTDDVVTRFLNVVGRMRSKGEFDWRMDCDAKLEIPCEEGKAGIVYQSDEHIGFTLPAFAAICRRCGYSRPKMLQALSEAKLRKSYTSASKQDRMMVHDADGHERRCYVYKFDEIDIPEI